MSYQPAQMLYINDDYYKWSAQADQDNPYYRSGADYTQLNRIEGYEVLYFINHVSDKRWGASTTLSTYQKIERMIRYSVPGIIRSHAQVEIWIFHNWSRH